MPTASAKSMPGPESSFHRPPDRANANSEQWATLPAPRSVHRTGDADGPVLTGVQREAPKSGPLGLVSPGHPSRPHRAPRRRSRPAPVRIPRRPSRTAVHPGEVRSALGPRSHPWGWCRPGAGLPRSAGCFDAYDGHPRARAPGSSRERWGSPAASRPQRSRERALVTGGAAVQGQPGPRRPPEPAAATSRTG